MEKTQVTYTGIIRKTNVSASTRYVIADWSGKVLSEHASRDALKAAMRRKHGAHVGREQESAYEYVDGIGWTLA